MSSILNDAKLEKLIKSHVSPENLSALRGKVLSFYEQQKFAELHKFSGEFLTRSLTEVGITHQWHVEAVCVHSVTNLKLKNIDVARAIVLDFLGEFECDDKQNNRILCRWLNSLSESLFQSGCYFEAQSVSLNSLNISQRNPEEYFEELTRAKNNLASVYFFLGQSTKAEEMFRSNLMLVQKHHGSNSPLAATIMNNLGELCRQGFRFHEANNFLEESLRIRKHCLPEYHFLISQSLNNLAFLRMNEGKYHSAKSFFNQALNHQPFSSESDREKANSSQWHQILSSKLGLAETEIQLGYLRSAEEQLEDALMQAKNILGDEHQRIAYILSLLSYVYVALGKRSLADTQIEKAKSLYIKLKLEEKPVYAQLLLTIAEVKLER